MAEAYADGELPENGFQPFLIEATTSRAIWLADMTTFEIFEAVNLGVTLTTGQKIAFPHLKNSLKFRGDSIAVQRWVPIRVADRLGPTAVQYYGIWEHHGNDVIIVDPRAVMQMRITRHQAPRS